MFSAQPKRKRKACVFKFVRFEELFRKTSFLWRISADDKPYSGNKLRFQMYPAYWTSLNNEKVAREEQTFYHVIECNIPGYAYAHISRNSFWSEYK